MRARAKISTALQASQFAPDQAESLAQELYDAVAHELAEKQRAAISDDSPAWVKVIPDLIDPEVP